MKAEESQIPAFLFVPIVNRDDKLRVIEDLRLLELWRLVNGQKPFNHNAAVKLQGELNARYKADLREQAEKRLKKLKTAEKRSLELHREIAELLFRVQVLGEPKEVNAGEIGWNTQIRDKVTRRHIGTPRTLLNQHVSLDWRTDVHASVNLEQHLAELRRKYDGFTYPFAFERARLPFERASRYLTFKIRLVWKSISVGSRTRKKVAALLSKYKKR